MSDSQSNGLAFAIAMVIIFGAFFAGLEGLSDAKSLVGFLEGAAYGFFLSVIWRTTGIVLIPLTQKLVGERGALVEKNKPHSALFLVVWPVTCGALLTYGCGKAITHLIR